MEDEANSWLKVDRNQVDYFNQFFKHWKDKPKVLYKVTIKDNRTHQIMHLTFDKNELENLKTDLDQHLKEKHIESWKLQQLDEYTIIITVND